jgi:Viral BACON domain
MKKLPGIFLCLTVLFFATSAFAEPDEETAGGGTISGTVYQSDGVTPLTGKNITVNAFIGQPCSPPITWVDAATVDPATGTYKTPGLPAGIYYLITWSNENYTSQEWWASPQSVRECHGAQSIVVADGLTVSGINFQLEPGGAASGTVYQSDGVTPLTGNNIWIDVFTEPPCGISASMFVAGAFVDPATGTYTVAGLPAETCYLRARSSENYINEWWASPQSVRDCASAQSIVATVGQTVTGINFQLDLGGAISGTVYQSDGVTPLTGKNITVNAYTVPCNSPTLVDAATIDSATGTYTIRGLPAGTYYLITWSFEDYIYIGSEWWASPQSVRNCASAQPIVVTVGQTVTGKNFQLDLGGAISGTVYQSDGVTPLTGKYIGITAVTGSPCGSVAWVNGTAVNPATGTYTMPGLPAENYYLVIGSNDYINEWWASPQSVRDCAGAQPIVVTVGQIVTGKNFRLDSGGALSVSPASRDVAKETGTTIFTVSNTGGGTMPWTASVTSVGSWLAITSTVSGTDTGTINCSFTANASTSARTGTIRVTASGATGSPVDVTVKQMPTVCTATLDGNLMIHIPVLASLMDWWWAPAYWADIVYEYNPTYPALIIFKMTNLTMLPVYRPECVKEESTYSDDFKIHIPGLLLADGITRLSVDMEYSPAFSTNGNTCFVAVKYGVVPW